MPLIKNSNLPTFDYLKKNGDWVADHNSKNPPLQLHIALINMMPDAAMQATERQFFSLISQSNPTTDVYIYPMTLASISRGEKASNYIKNHYYDCENIATLPLDMAIVTGANISNEDITKEPFWQQLTKIIDLIEHKKIFCLFSCLAAHALLLHKYKKQRSHMAKKLWGVFEHKIVSNHPLVRHANSKCYVPHSRFNDIKKSDFIDAGFEILISSETAGVHMAINDEKKWLCMQGHPEYNQISLMKEYKREVILYFINPNLPYPNVPNGYFSKQILAVLDEYKIKVKYAVSKKIEMPTLPEDFISKNLTSNWQDNATRIMLNWASIIYSTKKYNL